MRKGLRVCARDVAGSPAVGGRALLMLTAGCSPSSSSAPLASSTASTSSRVSKGPESLGVLSGNASPAGRIDPIPPASPGSRGKAIYLTGISPSGRPIRAQLAGSGADVPAAVLTCANCHGATALVRRKAASTRQRSPGMS